MLAPPMSTLEGPVQGMGPPGISSPIHPGDAQSQGASGIHLCAPLALLWNTLLLGSHSPLPPAPRLSPVSFSSPFITAGSFLPGSPRSRSLAVPLPCRLPGMVLATQISQCLH